MQLIFVYFCVPGTARNFKKYPKSDIDSLNMPYDYGSIMHYGRKAFSKNRQDTIVPKKKWVSLFVQAVNF